MKAVIPAAGLGTRFLPATKALPKEMLPVLNRPAIQYVVEEAINSGIDDILIITGRGKRAIEDHFDRSFELEHHLSGRKEGLREEIIEIGNMANIHYIRQKEPRGLGNAVYHARKFVGDEYFAVLLGDDIIVGERPCTAQLIDIHMKQAAPVIALERRPIDELSRYGVVRPKSVDDRLHVIADIIEKPSPEEAPSDLATMGRYVLPPEIFDVLERTPPGHGGEIQLTDAIRFLLKDKTFYGYEFTGRRYDVGSVLGWIETNVSFALQDPAYRDDLVDFLTSELRGMDI